MFGTLSTATLLATTWLPKNEQTDFIYFVIVYGLVSSGIFVGMVILCPLFVLQLHFPDRKYISGVIQILSGAAGLSLYYFLSSYWKDTDFFFNIAMCFFAHVILGSIMMVPPPKGQYREDDLRSLKLSLLNYRDHTQKELFK